MRTREPQHSVLCAFHHRLARSNSAGRVQAPRRYLTYLPQDNSGVADALSEQVVQAINDDLGQLLTLPVADFWEVVGTEESLIVCLDSYLRFAR